MAELQFYNTLTRQKEKFTPIDADNIRIYVCGPTVYDFAHIGNARPVIVFDTLFRLLRHVYGETHVRYVRNITDVDDKINARAARDYPNLPLNEAIAALTKLTEKQFHDDIAALNCLPPTIEPRATENIEQMKAIIERLVKNGHAYVADNHVLFSVPAMDKTGGSGKRANPPYGQLSKRPLSEMLAGARVDVADYKRDPMDFVLWKPSKQGEPGWASPCGITVAGRPGWHIECSAMSMDNLLRPFGGGLNCDDPQKNCFDIHGGGLDLIFPHHENEIAQSCCALGGRRMANFWLHNGFLQVEGQKMSKSLGNFITIRQILQTELPEFKDKQLSEAEKMRWAGLAARFSMLQTHYREPLNWTQARFEEASAELYKWYEFLRGQEIAADATGQNAEFWDALADDLSTPAAITILRRFYKEKQAAELLLCLDALGLLERGFLNKGNALFTKQMQMSEAEITALINRRLELIEAKNWPEADKIRDKLAAKGVKLMDGKDETGKRITKWELA